MPNRVWAWPHRRSGYRSASIVIDTGEQYMELINPPEIIEREGEKTSTEGCLSVPGIIGRVPRSLYVKVRGAEPPRQRGW